VCPLAQYVSKSYVFLFLFTGYSLSFFLFCITGSYIFVPGAAFTSFYFMAFALGRSFYLVGLLSKNFNLLQGLFKDSGRIRGITPFLTFLIG
jgi:hypothetical protein